MVSCMYLFWLIISGLANFRYFPYRSSTTSGVKSRQCAQCRGCSSWRLVQSGSKECLCLYRLPSPISTFTLPFRRLIPALFKPVVLPHMERHFWVGKAFHLPTHFFFFPPGFFFPRSPFSWFGCLLLRGIKYNVLHCRA